MNRFLTAITLLALTAGALAGCATGGGSAAAPEQTADLHLASYQFTVTGVLLVKEETVSGEKKRVNYLKAKDIQIKGADLSTGWMDRMQKVTKAVDRAARRGPFKVIGPVRGNNGSQVSVTGQWHGTDEFIVTGLGNILQQ